MATSSGTKRCTVGGQGNTHAAGCRIFMQQPSAALHQL